MAKRIVTAREQYELAEPFLREAKDEVPEEQPLPEPEVVEPEAVEPEAVESPNLHFHPDFKQWMDMRSTDPYGSGSNAWADYHNSPQDADWWHQMWQNGYGFGNAEPVTDPHFIDWMDTADQAGIGSWKDYHAHPSHPADYHELYQNAKAEEAQDTQQEPLAAWEQELLDGLKEEQDSTSINKIDLDHVPDWAKDGDKFSPELLDFLDGKGLAVLPPGVLFDSQNPEHVKALSNIHNPQSWDNLQKSIALEQPGSSFADKVQKAFGPAGFSVKTQDQFFQDHVPGYQPDQADQKYQKSGIESAITGDSPAWLTPFGHDNLHPGLDAWLQDKGVTPEQVGSWELAHNGTSYEWSHPEAMDLRKEWEGMSDADKQPWIDYEQGGPKPGSAAPQQKIDLNAEMDKIFPDPAGGSTNSNYWSKFTTPDEQVRALENYLKDSVDSHDEQQQIKDLIDKIKGNPVKGHYDDLIWAASNNPQIDNDVYDNLLTQPHFQNWFNGKDPTLQESLAKHPDGAVAMYQAEMANKPYEPNIKDKIQGHTPGFLGPGISMGGDQYKTAPGIDAWLQSKGIDLDTVNSWKLPYHITAWPDHIKQLKAEWEGMPEAEKAKWVDYEENGGPHPHAKEYVAPVPAPGLAPASMTDGHGNYTPEAAQWMDKAWGGYQKHHDDWDKDDWDAVESEWNAYQQQQATAPPPGGVNHQELINSPEFKFWFKHDNSGTDVDAGLLQQLSNSHNDWAIQKLVGFNRYQKLMNDPEFKEFVKHNGYDPDTFNRASPNWKQMEWAFQKKKKDETQQPLPYWLKQSGATPDFVAWNTDDEEDYDEVQETYYDWLSNQDEEELNYWAEHPDEAEDSWLNYKNYGGFMLPSDYDEDYDPEDWANQAPEPKSPGQQQVEDLQASNPDFAKWLQHQKDSSHAHRLLYNEFPEYALTHYQEHLSQQSGQGKGMNYQLLQSVFPTLPSSSINNWLKGSDEAIKKRIENHIHNMFESHNAGAFEKWTKAYKEAYGTQPPGPTYFKPTMDQIIEAGLTAYWAQQISGQTDQKFKENYQYVKDHWDDFTPDNFWYKIVQYIDGKGQPQSMGPGQVAAPSLAPQEAKGDHYGLIPGLWQYAWDEYGSHNNTPEKAEKWLKRAFGETVPGLGIGWTKSDWETVLDHWNGLSENSKNTYAASKLPPLIQQALDNLGSPSSDPAATVSPPPHAPAHLQGDHYGLAPGVWSWLFKKWGQSYNGGPSESMYWAKKVLGQNEHGDNWKAGAWDVVRNEWNSLSDLDKQYYATLSLSDQLQKTLDQIAGAPAPGTSAPPPKPTLPTLPVSSYTPAYLIGDDGKLLPQFVNWLWNGSDKSLDPAMFVNKVKSWNQAHWKAVEQAYLGSQEAADPLGTPGEGDIEPFREGPPATGQAPAASSTSPFDMSQVDDLGAAYNNIFNTDYNPFEGKSTPEAVENKLLWHLDDPHTRDNQIGQLGDVYVQYFGLPPGFQQMMQDTDENFWEYSALDLDERGKYWKQWAALTPEQRQQYNFKATGGQPLPSPTMPSNPTGQPPALASFDYNDIYYQLHKADPGYWVPSLLPNDFQGAKEKLEGMIEAGDESLQAGYNSYTPEEVQTYKDVYKKYFGPAPYLQNFLNSAEEESNYYDSDYSDTLNVANTPAFAEWFDQHFPDGWQNYDDSPHSVVESYLEDKQNGWKPSWGGQESAAPAAAHPSFYEQFASIFPEVKHNQNKQLIGENGIEWLKNQLKKRMKTETDPEKFVKLVDLWQKNFGGPTGSGAITPLLKKLKPGQPLDQGTMVKLWQLKDTGSLPEWIQNAPASTTGQLWKTYEEQADPLQHGGTSSAPAAPAVPTGPAEFNIADVQHWLKKADPDYWSEWRLEDMGDDPQAAKNAIQSLVSVAPASGVGSGFKPGEVAIYKALLEKYFGSGADTLGPGASSPTGFGPQPFHQSHIDKMLREADPNFWDDETLEKLHGDPEKYLQKITQLAKEAESYLREHEWDDDGGEGTYTNHELNTYKHILDNYLQQGYGSSTPSQAAPASAGISFSATGFHDDFKKAFPDSILDVSDFANAEKAKGKLHDLMGYTHYHGTPTEEKLHQLYEKWFGGAGGRVNGLPPGMLSYPDPGEGATDLRDDFGIRTQLRRMVEHMQADHTIYDDDDVRLAQTPEFQKWFYEAPEAYRKVVKEFPINAIEDFKNGGQYGWVPEGDEEQVYSLQHIPTTEEKGGEFTHPSGHKLQLPQWHHKQYPGHTINPKSEDSARPNADLVFKPRQPDVPNQLEIPLPGGSSWEPEVTYPTIRRGIDIRWNRYKPGNEDYDKLSLPGEEGVRHRAAASLLDEIKELMVGTKKIDRYDSSSSKRDPNAPFQESLFDDEETVLPDDMPTVDRHNRETDNWLDLVSWAMKNNLTPEQMWQMAKKAGSDNPEKYGTPPLSYLIAQSKRDPKMMARRVAELLGDADYVDKFIAHDGSLRDISKKLQAIRDNNTYYGNDKTYTPQQQAEAAMLYNKWFGEGFIYELLAHKILDYLEIGGWKPSGYRTHPVPGGMGPHWTTHNRTQFGNGSAGSQGFPVTVVAEWPGTHRHQTGIGEDTDRKDAAWGHHSENEIAINPGAPLIVKQLKMRHPMHPDSSEYIDIDLTPHVRHANVNVVVPARKPGRAILSNRERYAEPDYDDGGWTMDDDFHEAEPSRPSSLRTPMFGPGDRPQQPDGRYHFSPQEINPPPDAASRPDIHWAPKPDEQDPLPLDAPQGSYPNALFRGVSINLHSPEAAEIYRLIHGEHPQDNYLFDQGMHTEPRYDHPELGHAILDYLESSRSREDHDPVHGLGPHWTIDPTMAHDFAISEAHSALNDPGSLQLPVRLKANWTGTGENPYRSGTGEIYQGQFADENEINLLPGANLNISDVQIRHPQRRQWVSVLHQPQHREAAFAGSSQRPRSAKRIVSQREWLEG